MRKRVVITGLGAINPLGLNAKDTWNALIKGRSGAAQITNFDASENKTKFVAEVKDFDPVALFGRGEARRMDRYVQFALAAQPEPDFSFCARSSAAKQVMVHAGLGVT